MTLSERTQLEAGEWREAHPDAPAAEYYANYCGLLIGSLNILEFAAANVRDRDIRYGTVKWILAKLRGDADE